MYDRINEVLNFLGISHVCFAEAVEVKSLSFDRGQLNMCLKNENVCVLV